MIGPQIRVFLAITIALRLLAPSIAWTDAAQSLHKSDRRPGSALHGVTTGAVLAAAIKSAKTPVSFDAERPSVVGPRTVEARLVLSAQRAPGALRLELTAIPLGSRPPPTT